MQVILSDYMLKVEGLHYWCVSYQIVDYNKASYQIEGKESIELRAKIVINEKFKQKHFLPVLIL